MRLSRKNKVDDNQYEIIRGLRQIGCTVTPSPIGDGFPDIVVGWRKRTMLLEIKDGSKPPSQRRLTREQQKWHDEWKGHKAVVTSLEEAIKAVQEASL